MKVDCWGLPPRGRRAAAGLALAAAGRPSRRRHAMLRLAGGGWRGGVGCRTFLNLLQTKVARQVPAAGFGPWLWRRMGRWPGPLRRRRGRFGLPHHGFDGRNGLRRMPIRAVLACRTGRFTPVRRCLGWRFLLCPARNGCKPAGWLVCPHLAILAGWAAGRGKCRAVGPDNPCPDQACKASLRGRRYVILSEMLA